MSILSTCGLTGEPIPQPVPVFIEQGSRPTGPVDAAPRPTASPAPRPPLHRLAEARRREGLTHRRVAGRLGISAEEVQQQEDPSSDMLLSELYRWQEALQVPAAELLSEPAGDLSPPVQLRARLLRVMKTARSIQERARQTSVRRLATMLVEQLVEMVPELKDTVAWPAIGQRRSSNEMGEAFFRRISRDVLDDFEGSTS